MVSVNKELDGVMKGNFALSSALAKAIKNSKSEIVAEIMTITPDDAKSWLAADKNVKNRHVRKSHVRFLARQIALGDWELNGESIIIADDETLLDGQHRLMAIVEAKRAIQSLVVYGIPRKVFTSIDSGIMKTKADFIGITNPDLPESHNKALATAANWCLRIESKTSTNVKFTNSECIDYINEHPSLLEHTKVILAFAWKYGRPLNAGIAIALREMFWRKNQKMAEKFMHQLYTGEELSQTDAAYVLRMAFQRDAAKVTRYSTETKILMTVKAWNWLRRGNTETNMQVISVKKDTDRKIVIF